MRKKLWTLMLASCVAVSALAIACGDDDNNATSSSSGGTDGGPDANNTTDGGDSGADGGCTFAGFVHTIIASPANGTPSTDLGQSCTPSTQQSDFADLFAHH